MPDERHLQPVDGTPGASQIDRDLAQLLSIAPSPEFAARVRERIRDERAVRHPRATWWVGLATAAAAAVFVLMFASRAWRTEDAPREARTAVDTVLPVVTTQPPVQSTPLASPRPGAREARPPRGAAVAAATAHTESSQPEVLVPRDQLRAIARLRELTLNGELTEKNLPPVGGNPGTVIDIGVAPLTIAPLTVPEVEIHKGEK